MITHHIYEMSFYFKIYTILRELVTFPVSKIRINSECNYQLTSLYIYKLCIRGNTGDNGLLGKRD